MTKFLKIKKNATAFLFAFSCGLVMCAGSYAQTPVKINTTVAPEAVSTTPPDSLNVVDNSLDSLADVNPAAIVGPTFPIFPDSVYDARIHSLHTCLPVAYNEEVRKFIDLYTLRKREQVERMVGLSKFYFPIFDQVLTDNQMPTDLKYLAIIESALNPNAVSRCGAVGTWQFMFSTAKLYGLKVNGYVDERKDLIESTQAAATYLKNMYSMYGDWLLSIAAYNCGPGNVNRAINLSGGSYDFWTICRYLPRETRSYVPAFIAAMYVMNYYDTHDISPKYPDYNICDIASVDVYNKISFEQLSKYTNIPLDVIKFLNPCLRGEVTPVLTANDPFSLKLPAEKMELFEAMKDSIVLASMGYEPTFFASYRGRFYAGKSRTYVVKKGETLAAIAAKNKCSLAKLKSWNDLSGNHVHAGQKLTICYGKQSAPVKVNASYASSKSSSSSSKSKVVYYKVRSGDTLWRISNKYPGVSVADIMASNSSTKVHNLKPGTLLKINL